MISNTFNRYIWLLEEFRQKKRLLFQEISDDWSKSNLGDGKPLALRTFHQHRKAIEELFGVKIVCNKFNKYSYSIADMGVLCNDKTHQWLINSFSISNMIVAGHNMKGRIVFENIPHGTEYLQPIIDAMRDNKELQIDYDPFGGNRVTYHVQPYCMKVYNRRWYLLGMLNEEGALRHLSLDRIRDLETMSQTFVLPKDFNAERYYAHSVGIYVNKDLEPQTVRIRVFGRQVEYIRSVPLHSSQAEVLTRHQEFSEFQYKLCLTPELTSILLSMGNSVEVLEPQELRDEIKRQLTECLTKY